MKRMFKVKVVERYQKIVEVEADSLDEAEEIAEEKWNKGEIVLDGDDLDRAFFDAE